MTDQQQQLCQSSERILKLFLDESVNNKSISLQLWFNKSGKLQFRLSTASSRRENRRTTAHTDEGPAPVANRPPQRAPAQPQPTVTTRSTTAANKKRKTAPTISPVLESARSAPEASPEIPRCAAQQSQHALSFIDPNERKEQSSEHECSDDEIIPNIQQSESVYTSPFFNKNRFQALSSPQISDTEDSVSHQPSLPNVPKGHVFVPTMVCDNCSKPHKVLDSTSVLRDGVRKKVNYWSDIDAFDPHRCLCGELYLCNCIYNKPRSDVLPSKPDDL